MEMVLPTVKTMWCRKVINDEYNRTVEKLTSINKKLNEVRPLESGNELGQPVGELPFGARLYKVEGIEADSLLSMLKTSFKNKALIIDFWATWCAPCISEFPYSKKLSEESKDLPVEFIYLCTSERSDMEKWKSKIAEYKLSGHHLFVEKRLESALMNLFSFSGFPSYLLINKKGEYKADLISRPSNLNREKLLALIKQ
jgi:thiol-disulfide isomerase/thioredoxin